MTGCKGSCVSGGVAGAAGLPGRDPVTGKKLYASKTVRGGKREAQSALASMAAEADRGAVARIGATVGDLLERWFEHASPDFSPKTVLETRGVLDRYLVPSLGALRLTKLRTDDIDRYDNLGLWTALAPKRRRTAALKDASWDLSIGNGQPDFTQSWDSGRHAPHSGRRCHSRSTTL